MREQPSIPTAISEPTNVIRPTTPAERIQVIDILRGWAIFGILVVNMLHVSGYALFRESWTGSIDEAVAWSIQFFFRIKFVTLFSALFPTILVAAQLDQRQRGSTVRLRSWT